MTPNLRRFFTADEDELLDAMNDINRGWADRTRTMPPCPPVSRSQDVFDRWAAGELDPTPEPPRNQYEAASRINDPKRWQQ